MRWTWRTLKDVSQKFSHQKQRVCWFVPVTGPRAATVTKDWLSNYLHTAELSHTHTTLSAQCICIYLSFVMFYFSRNGCCSLIWDHRGGVIRGQRSMSFSSHSATWCFKNKHVQKTCFFNFEFLLNRVKCSHWRSPLWPLTSSPSQESADRRLSSSRPCRSLLVVAEWRKHPLTDSFSWEPLRQ